MQSCFWSFISEVSIWTELALYQGAHYNLCQLMLTVEKHWYSTGEKQDMAYTTEETQYSRRCRNRSLSLIRTE